MSSVFAPLISDCPWLHIISLFNIGILRTSHLQPVFALANLLLRENDQHYLVAPQWQKNKNTGHHHRNAALSNCEEWQDTPSTGSYQERQGKECIQNSPHIFWWDTFRSWNWLWTIHEPWMKHSYELLPESRLISLLVWLSLEFSKSYVKYPIYLKKVG